MRAFVSVDLEGMPYIVSVHHLTVGKALYSEARKIATRVTKIVVKELHEEGFDEIVVADSHGPMVNVLPEEMPEYVELVRGFPRPTSMVVGVEGSDAALFLGYHSRAGVARSTFDHTYSGVVSYVKVNGVEASEFLLNAYVAGHYGVPVILVAGDERLLEEVKERAPWAVRVPLKSSYTRYAARSPSFTKLEKALREGVKTAVSKLRNGEVRPLRVGRPVEVEVCFVTSGYADVAELAPGVRRLDGRRVTFQTDDIVSAYKLFELLVLASAGLAKVVSGLNT